MIIGICFECGDEGGVDNHHVVPESLGGTKTVVLCYKCHGLVHDRDFVNHRALQRAGIERAKAEGRFKGRQKGSSIKVKDFLEKESTKTIIDSLRKKLSLRKAAKDSGYSLGTVQKVKKLYDKNLTEIELNMTVADLLPKLNEVRVRVRNKKTKEKNSWKTKFIGLFG